MKSYVPVREYYPFSAETTERVEAWREVVNEDYNTYQDYLSHSGGKLKTILPRDGSHYVQVMDVRPYEHDEEEAVVVHLPMANPLDANMRFQVASIADVLGDKRVIAFANPSGPGRKYGALSGEQRRKLKHGDTSVLSYGYAAYLEREGINRTKEYGYSYGVDKALGGITMQAADVQKALLLEPASTQKRNILTLGAAFGATDKALQDYVEAGGMQIFEEARKSSIGLASYSLGLARLTNLAIAGAIAQGNFAEHFDQALSVRPELEAVVSWGTESELSEDSTMRAIVTGAATKHGNHRVKAARLEGQKHALANHAPLQAALVYEFLGK